MTPITEARRDVLGLCALLAWIAAAVHVVAAVQHVQESVPFAVAFAGLAVLQAAWGAWVLARPSTSVLLAGAAGSLAVVALWALSRTIGLPFGHGHAAAASAHGHGAGEPVGALDLLATSTELGLVVMAAALLWRPQSHTSPVPQLS